MKEERERTPLRIILQNFINHVENLEAYRSENSYEKEFQDLKLFSENLKTVRDYSCKEGEKEINRKKNRYKDILPFDYTRVTLSEYVGVPGSDYINANYIKGASGSPAYIASQGPLPHTVNDFWRMVVECEVQVIVMACNEEESGKHKCENYWVEKEGEEKKFGMATIRLLKASTICPDFLVRTMQLKYVNAHSILEERVVCQFHYGAWPDHGVPGLVRPLLEMVRLVRDTQASETLPVLVHCSAGCGRTGTICAIDYVWGLLRAGKLKLDFSLFKLVRDMRKQRIAMVQTKDQYILVHQAVKELFQDQLRMIHSHPYENIDIRGHPLVPALSSKASILNPGKAAPTEEKQDGREKESSVTSSSGLVEEATGFIDSSVATDAPPLPHKKRIHVVSSKQEKEVENLTQKQLSIASESGNTKVPPPLPVPGNLAKTNDKEMVEKTMKKGSVETLTPPNLSKASNHPLINSIHNFHPIPTSSQAEGLSNDQKPCIAKLKALFESNAASKETRPSNSRDGEVKPRLPQLVTRSHSLGAVRKPQKFSQFNAGALETGMNLPASGSLNESERFKSVSNTHVDISCTSLRGTEENTNTSTSKTDKPLNSHQMSSAPMSSHKTVHSNAKCLCEPSASLPLGVKKSLPSSTILVSPFQHESPSQMTEKLSVTELLPDTPRPALPIKRSKSLKAKMIGENFKLSLAKRSHGQSQELATSEKCSIRPPCSLNDCKSEIKLVPKVLRAYDALCHSDKVSSSPVYKGSMSGKTKPIPSMARIELSEASGSVNKSLEINESYSEKIGSSSEAPELKAGLSSSRSTKKSSAESEYLAEGSEMKKAGEYVVKPNCDVCRAQSLNLKREKSCHTFSTFSQESEYVNLKKVDLSDITKPAKEPLKFRSPNNNISETRTQTQPQNSMPIDASSVFEHCNSYLLSEGVAVLNTSESQRIAAANARHKVDTVIGGLGIRERRNSFRCAVGQGIDEKNRNSVTKNKICKWPPSNVESNLLVQPDEATYKRQFELKSSSAIKRHENKELEKKSNLRSQVVEPSATFKSPAGFQKFPLANECKYLPSVQKTSENYGEVNNVQKLNKLVRMTDTSPISSDIAPENVRPSKKTLSDSSSFQTSSSPWKHSVATSDQMAAYLPVVHKSNLNASEVILLNSTKSSTNKPMHYLWASQQVNSVPHKKDNLIDSAHASEKLGPQQNPNLVVPLEVDVDKVGASMRHNLLENTEGTKSPITPENINQGSSGGSTHFTRALEVFHQTAASIRTKFSRSTGSVTNSLKSSEFSPKMSPITQSHPASLKTHQNAGSHRRGEGNVCDQPKVLKKQQQYL